MEERNTYELPGVGDFRARAGTSTAELAGMAAFWHAKYKRAWRDGFFSACVVGGTLGIIAAAVLHWAF